MNYIDMVNSKIEALSAAKDALSIELLECKDHLDAFNNADVYASFKEVGSSDFFDLVRILEGRRQVVEQDMKSVSELLSSSVEELRLLSWGECDLAWKVSSHQPMAIGDYPF